MNRALKFRAFLQDEKRMIFSGNQLGDFFGDCSPVCSFGDSVVSNLVDVTQFTGLKDKNGVDIYEGDILREPPQSEWDKINYNCHEVFFHDNDACSYNIGWQMDRMHCHGSVCGGYTPSFKPSSVKNLIVIGNIYENPELCN